MAARTVRTKRPRPAKTIMYICDGNKRKTEAFRRVAEAIKLPRALFLGRIVVSIYKPRKSR